MDDKTKLQHFRNLISLSIADGKIHDSEKQALEYIAGINDIPLDRVQLMLDHAEEYIYFIPQNNKERELQLKQMIDLAIADGEFTQAEYDLILMVAQKLGFSKEELDQYIESNCGTQNIV